LSRHGRAARLHCCCCRRRCPLPLAPLPPAPLPLPPPVPLPQPQPPPQPLADDDDNVVASSSSWVVVVDVVVVVVVVVVVIVFVFVVVMGTMCLTVEHFIEVGLDVAQPFGLSRCLRVEFPTTTRLQHSHSQHFFEYSQINYKTTHSEFTLRRTCSQLSTCNISADQPQYTSIFFQTSALLNITQFWQPF